MSETLTTAPPHPLREVWTVYFAITLGTVGITQLGERVSWLSDFVHVFVAALFLACALGLARREPNGATRYGIDLGGLLEPRDGESLLQSIKRGLPSAARETAVAIALAALIFPPFTAAFYFWWTPPHAFTWQLSDDFGSFVLAQIIVVGLPEEALFRGALQTRLTDAWPRTRRFLGADLSPGAWLLQAALFGVMHFLVDLDVQRLAVFFPALAFAWLRAWRGGIGAAIVFHALCNIYADLLYENWMR